MRVGPLIKRKFLLQSKHTGLLTNSSRAETACKLQLVQFVYCILISIVSVSQISVLSNANVEWFFLLRSFLSSDQIVAGN